MSGKLYTTDDVDNENDDNEDTFAGDPLNEMKTQKSTLGSLFSAIPDELSVKSLSYTPPKQGESKIDVTHPTQYENVSKAIFATAAHAYLANATAYESHGKVGVAILYSHKDGKDDSKLLLYYANKQPLCQMYIKSDTSVIINNLYAQFTDNTQRRWSIAFDTNDLLAEFVRKLLVCQHFANPSEVRSIAINTGTGRNVTNDDNVELDFVEYEFETPFDLELTGGQSGSRVHITAEHKWYKTLSQISTGGRAIFTQIENVTAQSQTTLVPGSRPPTAPKIIDLTLRRIKGVVTTEEAKTDSKRTVDNIMEQESTDDRTPTQEVPPEIITVDANNPVHDAPTAAVRFAPLRLAQVWSYTSPNQQQQHHGEDKHKMAQPSDHEHEGYIRIPLTAELWRPPMEHHKLLQSISTAVRAELLNLPQPTSSNNEEIIAKLEEIKKMQAQHGASVTDKELQQLERYDALMTRLQQSIDWKMKHDTLSIELDRMKLDLDRKCAELENCQKGQIDDKKLRKTLGKVYKQFDQHIDDNQSYNGSEIKQILLEFLQKFTTNSEI